MVRYRRVILIAKDSRMVTENAISPHQACRGAIIIRDAALHLVEISKKLEDIDAIRSSARARMNEKKELFDQLWKKHYFHVAEYWTFEYTIQSFKV